MKSTVPFSIFFSFNPCFWPQFRDSRNNPSPLSYSCDAIFKLSRSSRTDSKESIPPAYVGAKTLFLLGSYPPFTPIDCLTIRALMYLNVMTRAFIEKWPSLTSCSAWWERICLMKEAGLLSLLFIGQQGLGDFFSYRSLLPIGWRIVQILRQRRRKTTNTAPTILSAIQAESKSTFISEQ